MNSLKPIQSKGRIDHIDVTRGIAILGILLVNMAHFSYPDLYLSMVGPDNFFTAGWGKIDNLTITFLNIFVQMKFILIFSFLFGFGMIMIMLRAEEQGQRFSPFYVRRLFALFLFGVIHAFFIWDGDILMDYALLGFILFLYRKFRPKTLLITAIVLYILFSLPIVISETIFVEDSEELLKWQEEMIRDHEENAKQALRFYSEGTFIEIAKQRIHDRMYYMSINGMLTLNPLLYLFANIPYFTMFLLGAYFAKKKVLHRPSQHKKSLKKLWLISFMIGLPCNILYGMLDQEVYLIIGAPFLALFYILTVVFLISYSWGRKLFMPFKAIGRMAFTNYILQSIIATTIFYNYGLGLYGKINPFVGLFLTLGIVGFQLVLSNIWLKHFRYGPLEWLWRIITYKSIP